MYEKLTKYAGALAGRDLGSHLGCGTLGMEDFVDDFCGFTMTIMGSPTAITMPRSSAMALTTPTASLAVTSSMRTPSWCLPALPGASAETTSAMAISGST